MKYDITEDWSLYEQGKDYNHKLHPSYYKTVDKNYRFYSNDQWYGVQANGLPTPVFNIFKQIIDYKIQSILSSKVKMQFGVENIEDESQDPQDQELQKIADMLSGYSETKWEKLKMDSLIRDGLLDGALSGDICLYTYWDASIDSHSTNGMGQDGNPVKVMGDFVTELVDGSNVMFGNPNNFNVEAQPYILIAGREMVSKLKDEAKANKVKQEDYEKIAVDTDTEEQAGDRGKIEIDSKGDSGKCLYVIKLKKEKGKIMMQKSTKYCVITPMKDTGLTRYPVAWTNWTRLKNSYHGQAEGTGLIPNQILINQMFAMIAYFMRMQAFGKVIYDKSRISAWNNAIGSSIGVEGDITGAVQQLQPGQMNNMIMTSFDKAVSLTKELCGANDTALGNVDPKNTSAIIATQKQSSVPLEGVKANLYQLVEDLGLIWLDFMLNMYKVDRKISYKVGDKAKIGMFNGSQYKDIPFKIKVDVGPSSYWSEITSMQTLDNLLQGQKIDFIQYLERMPNGIIPKKQELIDELKMRIQQQQDMAQQQQIQQQQQGAQAQQMQQMTQQMQDAHKQLTYEKMAQFEETLAPEVRQKLKEMTDSEHESYVMELMKQGGAQ